MFEQVRHYSRLHIFSFEKIILLKSFPKILRGNAKTIKIQLSFGAGGRGLCVGEAELTNEMRAEAKLVWIMPNEEEVRVAKTEQVKQP